MGSEVHSGMTFSPQICGLVHPKTGFSFFRRKSWVGPTPWWSSSAKMPDGVWPWQFHVLLQIALSPLNPFWILLNPRSTTEALTLMSQSIIDHQSPCVVLWNPKPSLSTGITGYIVNKGCSPGVLSHIRFTRLGDPSDHNKETHSVKTNVTDFTPELLFHRFICVKVCF